MLQLSEDTNLNIKKLIGIAEELTIHRKMIKEGLIGNYICALMSSSGAVYSGISVTMNYDLGNCAEQAAIAEMLKHGETSIAYIVSIDHEKNIVIPCGKCLDFMLKLDNNNEKTNVLLADGSTKTVSELLPLRI